MGGTLFIDEAYTLTNKGSNDVGHIAVELLLKQMEDRRGEFIVLVAGYEDEMEEFLDSNKGLRRRFDYRLVFEDYTPEEMIRIAGYYMMKSSIICQMRREICLLTILLIYMKIVIKHMEMQV